MTISKFAAFSLGFIIVHLCLTSEAMATTQDWPEQEMTKIRRHCAVVVHIVHWKTSLWCVHVGGRKTTLPRDSWDFLGNFALLKFCLLTSVTVSMRAENFKMPQFSCFFPKVKEFKTPTQILPVTVKSTTG